MPHNVTALYACQKMYHVDVGEGANVGRLRAFIPSEKSPRPETARKAASRQRGVCQRLSGTICPQPREQYANDADALQCIASSQAQRSAACIPLRSRSVAADASCNARNAARNAGRPATCLADVD